MAARDNATFYRQQSVDAQNRDLAMTDDLRKSELDRYDKAIQAIQANPGIPDDQKNLAITKIRQQGINIMTPSLGKKRVADLKAQFGIPDVPVNTPTEFQTPAMPAAPLSAPVSASTQAPAGSMDENGNATSVAPVMPAAPLEVPAKPASNYAVKPMDTTEALTMGTKAYNKFELLKNQLMATGMSEDDANRAIQVQAGLQAPAKQEHPTDYAKFLASFAKDRGKLSSELGPEENLEARKVWAASQHNVIQKTGDFADFVKRAAEENGLKPEELSSESILGLKKAFAAAGQVERVSHGVIQFRDDVTGKIYTVPITRSSAPVPVSMPNLHGKTPLPNAAAPAPAATARSPVVAPIAVKPEAGQPALNPTVAAPRTAAARPVPATPAALKASTNAAAGPMPGAKQIGQTASVYDKANAKTLATAQSDYLAAIDRQKRMDENLIAAKKGDQQAMLSLVANHIGMTLGAQKGARINQAVWNEAIQSAPFLQRAAARFGPDGLLMGVALSPEQMDQMVRLAHENVGVMSQHVGTLEGQLPERANAPRLTGTVNMRAPNGQIKPVPRDQVEHYKSLGAVEVK